MKRYTITQRQWQNDLEAAVEMYAEIERLEGENKILRSEVEWLRDIVRCVAGKSVRTLGDEKNDVFAPEGGKS